MPCHFHSVLPNVEGLCEGILVNSVTSAHGEKRDDTSDLPIYLARKRIITRTSSNPKHGPIS